MILEPHHTEDGHFCRRYLQKVGYNYEGRISLAVYGEILASIVSIDNYNDMHDFLDTLVHLIKVRKISLYVPRNIGSILTRILELDPRITPTDREISASAVEDKALNLVTLDTKLISNKVIEGKFDIKIKHPKELL